jgi:hypothetical protein
MQAYILTVLLTGLTVFNLFGQDETQFIIRKTPVKPAPQKFYYQTTAFNTRTFTFDSVIAGYLVKATDTFRWIKLPAKADTLQNGPTPEFSFTYALNTDTLGVKYGNGVNLTNTAFFFNKTHPSLKGNFSFVSLLTNLLPRLEVSSVLDTALNVTVDTAKYTCMLVLLTYDTITNDYAVKIKGSGIFPRKRTQHVYTYCYLRNTDLLPVKIIQTRPTPDSPDRDIPGWLVNKFWLVKYHT